MSFRTDSGGIAFGCNDIKLSGQASTWGTRLSQLGRMTGIVRIITYSLPDLHYVKTQLGRRPHDILIIAHDRFHLKATDIKHTFPDIRIALHNGVHSKLLLIAPETIWLSSENFGESGWHETAIGLHSRQAHDYMVNEFAQLWARCQEVA